MTAVDIRGLAAEDLEAAGRLLIEAYPYRADEPRRWDRPAPNEQPRRWGAFRRTAGDAPHSSGEVIGYAALWNVDGGKFRFDVVVSPRVVRTGVGASLFDVVAHDAEAAGVSTLQARARAADHDALRFLASRQFVETMRMQRFVLDFATEEVPDVSSTVAEGSTPPGISIAAVSERQVADFGFWNALADLQNAARDGWPDPDPGGAVVAMPPAVLRSMIMPTGEPPMAFFLATRGDRLVGYSALIRRRAIGEVQFVATAVRPDARRHSVGTVMRRRCLAVARAAGCVRAYSNSGSDAIARMNAHFGFREYDCEVRLVRHFGAGSAANPEAGAARRR